MDINCCLSGGPVYIRILGLTLYSLRRAPILWSETRMIGVFWSFNVNVDVCQMPYTAYVLSYNIWEKLPSRRNPTLRRCVGYAYRQGCCFLIFPCSTYVYKVRDGFIFVLSFKYRFAWIRHHVHGFASSLRRMSVNCEVSQHRTKQKMQHFCFSL